MLLLFLELLSSHLLLLLPQMPLLSTFAIENPPSPPTRKNETGEAPLSITILSALQKKKSVIRQPRMHNYFSGEDSMCGKIFTSQPYPTKLFFCKNHAILSAIPLQNVL